MVLSGKHRAIVAVAVVAVIAAACSGDDSDDADGGGSGAGGDVTRAEESGSFGAVSDDALRSGDAASSAGEGGSGDGIAGAPEPAHRDALSIGPQVIKTASVSLEIPRKEFRGSIQEAIDVAQTHGGFVLSTETAGDRRMRGTVVLRIPAENFEVALGELKGLGEVESETISGKDVSEEFVDLEARLRNLEAQEAVLLRLMDRAQTVSGTIKVQRELSGVQLEVERLRGRLRFLEDQTAYGTIRMDLTQAGAAPPAEQGALEKAWETAKDTAVAVVSGVIVGAGFLLPIGALVALLALAFRFARPRFTGTP